MLKFTKMHGCGNDYIYFNCLEQNICNPEELSVKLSDRHFGVGGDGIIMILPSDKADAKMRMFNADGSEGNMCGNAIRCIGKYIYDNKIVSKETVTIDTKSGIKTLKLEIKDGVCVGAYVDMGKPILRPEEIPVRLSGDIIVDFPVKIEDNDYNITCVSMGNPHCIVFCHDVDDIDLPVKGPQIENNPLFPDRVNAEFVQIIDENTVKMRVWERGSGETLACGTGACAVTVACVLNGFCKKDCDVTVKLRGGELKIKYSDEGVTMYGPATSVFDGVLSYDE